MGVQCLVQPRKSTETGTIALQLQPKLNSANLSLYVDETEWHLFCHLPNAGNFAFCTIWLVKLAPAVAAARHSLEIDLCRERKFLFTTSLLP